MEKYETIRLERMEGIAVITLNLSDILGALIDRIARDLLSALQVCGEVQEVKVVVLKRSGQAPSLGEYLRGDNLFEAIFSRAEDWSLREIVFSLPKPIVAL